MIGVWKLPRRWKVEKETRLSTANRYIWALSKELHSAQFGRFVWAWLATILCAALCVSLFYNFT